MIIDYRMVPPFSMWMDSAEISAILHSGLGGQYGEIYSGRTAPFSPTLEELLRDMDEAGVRHAVLQAEWLAGDYRKLNDAVAQLVAAHPDRFVAGYLTVDPAADPDMASVVEAGVRDRGFRGVNLQPYAYRLRCSDRTLYPLYEKCLELDIPVTIHTSVNFTTDRAIDYGRPLHLDQVACDFPDLKLVANHGGWPWVAELVAVAWKHPNVYIEIGAISPKYIGTPGTGWEPLMVYGNTLLQDRVLWATDSMVAHTRAVGELRSLPLKESVKEKWLGLNAAKLLGIEVTSQPLATS